MRAEYPLAAERHDWQPRRRLTAFAIVLAVHLLLALLLLTLTPPETLPPALKTFIARAIPAPVPSPKPAAKAQKAAAKASKAPPRANTKAVPPARNAPPAPELFDMHLFEGVDIAKLPNRRAELAAEGADTASNDSQAAYGPGAGPGGATLYSADWYREPTDAELSTYLPGRVPSGSWAMIACRTIEGFRVEDCRELGESPQGSGLARGVVNAAWQFRVLPPRLNGKKLVGSWVSIRIDFSDAGAEIRR